MRRHLENFIALFLAIAFGTFGILAIKGLYRDFSLIDFSLEMFVLPFFAGISCLAFGIYIGFYAFKRMRSS